MFIITIKDKLISLKELFIKGKFVFLISLTEKTSFFISYLIIAHFYTKNEFGLVTTIFAFANIISSLLDFGFTIYFQREAATNSLDLPKKIDTALTLRLSALVIFFISCIAFFYYEMKFEPFSILLFSLSVYIISFGYFLNSILYGKSLYDKSFIGIFISRIVLVFLSISIILFKFDLVVLAIFYVFAFSLNLIFLIKNLKTVDITLRFDFNFIKPAYQIVKSSLPFGIGILFVWIYDRAAFLFLHKMIDLESVAIFTVVYSLYKIPQAFLGTILLPLFSELSSFYFNNKYLERKIILPTARWIIIISIGLVVFYLSAHQLLIKLTFGINYIEASNLLALISLAIPGLFLNNLTGVLLNSAYKENLNLNATIISVSLNLILNFIFIKTMGIVGAVVTVIITEYSILFIQIYYIMKTKIMLK